MDSAGNLPEKWLKKYEIEVIPINVHLGDQLYLERESLTIDQFYQWVRETGQIPKSSQPTPQQYLDFYHRISNPGDPILSIHLTSKLSGTYESAVIAAQQLQDEGMLVKPFDSLSGTAIMGYMCCEAREMDRNGASLEAIIRRLEEIREHNEVIFTLDSLDFAHKSGRVQLLESVFASLLKIKPIVVLRQGTLSIYHKVRTRKAALDFILQEMARRLGNKLVNAAVIHAHDFISAEAIAEKVKEIIRCKEFFIEELSIGIAANLGPGTIGIVAYPAKEGSYQT